LQAKEKAAPASKRGKKAGEDEYVHITRRSKLLLRNSTAGFLLIVHTSFLIAAMAQLPRAPSASDLARAGSAAPSGKPSLTVASSAAIESVSANHR
jgi:hypothetical protein